MSPSSLNSKNERKKWGGVVHLEAPCQDAREVVQNCHFVDLEQGFLVVVNIHVAKKYTEGELP